jgi:hypothetical protein
LVFFRQFKVTDYPVQRFPGRRPSFPVPAGADTIPYIRGKFPVSLDKKVPYRTGDDLGIDSSHVNPAYDIRDKGAIDNTAIKHCQGFSGSNHKKNLGAFFAAAKNRAIRLYLLPGKPDKRIPLLSLARKRKNSCTIMQPAW